MTPVIDRRSRYASGNLEPPRLLRTFVVAREMGSRSLAPKVVVIGAGWSGAVTARQLVDRGFDVEVFERSSVVGGHARTEVLNGVVYEPNGAHIFHTSNPTVAEYVRSFGVERPYAHKVLAEVFLHPDDDDDEKYLLSWPPQVEELRELPLWPTIERELAALPPRPLGDNFEDYVISLMGPTLYSMFIRDYTVKQWGCDPRLLSSNFAPKRIDLRSDGNRRLFRDTWEFFPECGVNSAIEAILSSVKVTCGTCLTLADVDELEWDGLVVTAPLDSFTDSDAELAWRGINMRSRYVPLDRRDATVTPAYVINHPSRRVQFTRTVETKHASGQLVCGTVVSEEYPGSSDRHYPVPTVAGTYEHINLELKRLVREKLARPVFFCGRLANYVYINQDEAIDQAVKCAEEVWTALV